MLYEQFVSLSKSHNSRTVLVHRDRAFSGFELNRAVDRLATLMCSLGVDEQDRVGILLGNTPLFVLTFLAALKLRASCVLLNTYFTARELADSVSRTGPKIVVTTEPATERLAGLDLEPVELRREPFDGSEPLCIWQSATRRPKAVKDEFTIQFTSGVSGRSKIVPRTSGNLADELTHFAAGIRLRAHDAVICPAPLFHTYGVVNGFLLPFFAGATALLVDKFFPNDVVDAVRRYRPTVLIGVPPMYNAISDCYGATADDLSSLRICFSAGAPLTQETFDKFRERYYLNIHQQYGSTETGVIALNLLQRTDANPLAVGHPVAGRAIRLLKDDQQVEPGEEGEVVVRSVAAATKYLDDPELSEQKFRGGWYHTGDLGVMAANGELRLTGRISSLINVAGLKVDPNEIEAALRGCDAIAECAVVGVPDPATGHDLIKAYVIARRKTSRQELLTFCRPRLAAYKFPRHVEFVDALPKSATGKVLIKYLIDAHDNVTPVNH